MSDEKNLLEALKKLNLAFSNVENVVRRMEYFLETISKR